MLEEFYTFILGKYALRFRYEGKIVGIYSDIMETCEISKYLIHNLIMKSLQNIDKQVYDEKWCRFYNASFVKLASA